MACSSKEGTAAKSASRAPARAARTNDSAAGSVDLAGTGYKPGPLTAIGSVAGTVHLDGAPPADSTPIQVAPEDAKVCGNKVESSVDASAKGVADVIVWIADAKSGKPLSNDKRFELSSEHCQLDPRIQVAPVGSTVNVFNDDKVIHRLEFIAAANGDTLQTMRFFNDGQVVASEVLAKTPGIVEVRCVQHPWSKAFIAVFDHPYYAVTERDGGFKIDSLPPGKYTLNVWHEGMGKPVTQSVQVDPSGTARIDLAIKLR